MDDWVNNVIATLYELDQRAALGYDIVKLPDRIGIVQPLALAVAAGGGGNTTTYTRQLGTYQGGGGGDYGIAQGGKVSVRL